MSLLKYLAFALSLMAVILIVGAAMEICEKLDETEAGERSYEQ